MGQWEIFLTIVEIVAFLALVLGLFSKFSATLNEISCAITEFRGAIAQLKETVTGMKKDSHETHKEIFDKLDDHETRISHLEK